MALGVRRGATAQTIDSGSVGATPLAGSEARLAPEDACQMCLVGKATRQGNLGERFLALEHFPPSPLDTPVEDESVRRLPEGAFEGAREVAVAQLSNIRQLADGQGPGEIVVDMADDALSLPRRE